MINATSDVRGWLQRRVGTTFAGTALAVAILQAAVLVFGMDPEAPARIVIINIASLSLVAVLFVWSGRRSSIWGAGLQVAVLILIAFVSAATSDPAELTSFVFLAVAVVLSLEYFNEASRLRLALGMLLATYLVVLTVNQISKAPTGTAAASTLFAVLLALAGLSVMIFAIVQARQMRYEREHALLEGTVAERTAELQAAVRERETIMQELHHRSKNNLQLVKSLLDLSESQVADERVSSSLQKSSDRILSIALVHEQLYRSDRFGDVNLRGYLADLVSALSEQRSGRVHLHASNIEGLVTSIDVAVPLGLVVTELVSNAFEHGDPPGEEGVTVTVDVMIEGTRLSCTVADNGEGDAEQIDFEASESMGLSIARGLCQQLSGSLEIGADPDGGVRAKVTAHVGEFT
jgi:two-component sensor histidine kinase